MKSLTFIFFLSLSLTSTLTAQIDSIIEAEVAWLNEVRQSPVKFGYTGFGYTKRNVLERDPILDSLAQLRIEGIVKEHNNAITHAGFDTLSNMYDEVYGDVYSSSLSEALAYGYDFLNTFFSIGYHVNGHTNILMDKQATAIGIGVIYSENDLSYICVLVK